MLRYLVWLGGFDKYRHAARQLRSRNGALIKTCARAAGPETYSVRSALQPGSATTGLQPAHDETLLSYAQQLTRPRRTLESISRDLCGIAVGMRGMRSAGCFCCHSFVEAPG